MTDEEFDQKYHLEVLGHQLSIKSITFDSNEMREKFIECIANQTEDDD